MFGRERTDREQPRLAQPSATRATFHGFSTATDRTVFDTGLYEFYNDRGVLIRIHDGNCTRITFQPEMARLDMTFDFDEPGYAPIGLAPDAGVNLSFDQVAILSWNGDLTSPDPVDVPGGQVSELSFAPPQFFRLYLLSSTLEFTAQRVELAIT